MRAAVLMLALVLITSYFVGGTFAKYVTSKSGTDSARVAKFGVTVTANGDVFAKEYDTDDQTVVGTIAKSVISTDKVVAPGTKSSYRYRHSRGGCKSILQIGRCHPAA